MHFPPRQAGMKSLFVAFLVLQMIASSAIVSLPTSAQSTSPRSSTSCLVASEPNDGPETALDLGAGESCANAENPLGGQDLYRWTVDEAAAGTLWTMSATAIPGQVIKIEVYRIEEDAAGTLISAAKLISVGGEGSAPAEAPDLFWPAGEYIIGVATSGPGPYQLRVEPGATLGQAASGPMTATGSLDLSGSLIAYTSQTVAWIVDETTAATHHDLLVQAPVDSGMNWTLSREDGTLLFSGSVSPAGLGQLRDLGLEVGTYTLQLDSSADLAWRVLSTATTARAATLEDEPNDDVSTAMPLAWDDDAISVSGRLATSPAISSDRDTYRVAIDKDRAGRYLDLRLIAPGMTDLQLCLLTGSGEDIRCTAGNGGLLLDDLVLPEGTLLLTVSGPADPTLPYTLKLDVTTAAALDYEQEPNNSPARANAMVPDGESFTIAGRLGPDDIDLHRITLIGDPQLWLVQASGQGVESVELLNTSGYREATARTTGEEMVELYDLYLLPGDSLFQIQGIGDYTLVVTPLGPPDPAYEIEPNDSIERSMPMVLGETREGRLATATDVDAYRFALQGTTSVQLDLMVPPDGAMVADLERNGIDIVNFRPSGAGGSLVWEGVLPAGDYQIRLSSIIPSTERYTLGLTPLDPFMAPVDREPNDIPSMASPMELGTPVDGALDLAIGDGDWYELTVPPGTGQLVVAFEPDITVALYEPGPDPVNPIALPAVAGTEAGHLLADAPTGETLLVNVSSYSTQGAYHFRIDPVDAPQDLVASPVAAPENDLAISLTFETTSPAAFWTEGQRVGGNVSLTNRGSTSIAATLSGMVAHDAWTFTMPDSPILLDAGETLDIPVTLEVAPDAFARQPIVVAVAATLGEGEASAFTLVTPNGESVPHAPFAWPWVPEELAGGLNVGWLGLGAVPVVDDSGLPDSRQLFNEILRPGDGIRLDTALLPAPITIDLAGDAPVPVRGFALLPRGLDSQREAQLRRYELQLSTDGVTFDTVAAGDMTASPAVQYVVLETPVDATAARLIVVAPQQAGFPRTYLGEWKVLADPGWQWPGDQLNVADPGLGGHVVDIQPPVADAGSMHPTVLTPADRASVVETPAERGFDVTIGFHHNRVALIDTIEWHDGSDSSETQQVTRVQVQVSTESPIGPWTSVGEFDLNRDGSGTATIELATPTWARFVKVIALDGGALTTGEDLRVWELPGQLVMWEAHVDDEYRSILGEWGTNQSTSRWEQLQPTVALDLDDDAGNNQQSATTLLPGVPITNAAGFGVDDDWFAVTVPEGEPVLTLTLTGLPSLGVEATLYAQDGSIIPTEIRPNGPSSVDVTAVVKPGQTYAVQVAQSPASVVFAFDTSFSIGALEPTVQQGLLRFARDILPEREFVNVLPFGGEFLLPAWTDDSYLLQSVVVNNPRQTTSSDSEGALVLAMEHLGEQPGTRAIVIISDAESSPSLAAMTNLWPEFAAVAPRVFSVNIAGSSDATAGQDHMQDWAMVNHGSYTYASSQGEMDSAFERAATELRRPTVYQVVATSSPLSATPTPEPTPTPDVTATPVPTPTPTVTETPVADGAIAVGPLSLAVTPGEPPPPAAGQVAMILDTSGSMLQGLDGQTRADVARAALTDLVTTVIPPGTLVSLRTFGDTPDSCETLLVVPPGPLDPVGMANTIADLPVVNLVKTPIGAALTAVAGDLEGGSGPKIVVLVTDGEETCDGDAATAIAALVDSGIDVRVNIVGFAIDDPLLQETFAEWAALGNGSYFDAANASELNAAIALAVQPSYDIMDANGSLIASSQAGSPPVMVPPGTYQIVVRTVPEIVIGDVVVVSGETTELSLQIP